MGVPCFLDGLFGFLEVVIDSRPGFLAGAGYTIPLFDFL